MLIKSLYIDDDTVQWRDGREKRKESFFSIFIDINHVLINILNTVSDSFTV